MSALFDLDPGEELALVAETARKFAADALLPHARDAESQRGPSTEARRDFEAIGLAGLELPESLGGAELGAVGRALVNEELGAGDPGATLALDPLGLALYPALEMGGSEAVRRLAETVAAGGPTARACLVTDDEAEIHVEADTLSADIAWIPADRADAVVLLGNADAWLVSNGLEITTARGAGLRAAGACRVRLSSAPIAARLEGAAGAARARARARIYVASLLLGVLRRACEFSRGYALERQAFGRPIAHHQALAFLITDMHMAVEGARLLVHEAAWLCDRGQPCAGPAASAFAQCIEASRLVGPGAVQILGGHGFMQDYPVEKSMREARCLGLMLGGFDAAIEEAGRVLCESGDFVDLGAGAEAL